MPMESSSRPMSQVDMVCGPVKTARTVYGSVVRKESSALTGMTLASLPISCMATTSTTSYDECVIGSPLLVTWAVRPIMAVRLPDWT